MVLHYEQELEERAEEAASFIAEKLVENHRPLAEWAIILGSGLQDPLYLDVGSEGEEIEFRKVPHMPFPSVQGHRGTFQYGKIGHAEVMVQRGRVHYYENGSLEQVTFSLRVLRKLGVDKAVMANAAGALNPTYEKGYLMLVRDHINLLGDNPLIGGRADPQNRFVELSSAYDEEMGDLALSLAQMLGAKMVEGVLVCVSGPSYETGAELRFLRVIGGDAVTMSVVPEVIFARYLGMRVMAVSCITNVWDLRRPYPISHEEVLQTAQSQAPVLERIVRQVIEEMG